MKMGLRERASSLRVGTLLICGFSSLLLLGTVSVQAADLSQNMAECAAIENDGERLKCYDQLAGRNSRKMEEVTESKESESTEKTPKEKEEESFFSRLWDLDPETRGGRFAIRPHRSNYILPLTYNFSPNAAAVQEGDPDKDVMRTEVKFQLSVKVKLLEDILNKDMDLWFAYTQQSFWQLYNFDDSSPFRETDYEPELLLNFRTQFDILGLTGRFFNVGFNHQSNGQSEPLSRSWNRIVGSVGLERNRFSLLMKGWYRIPESSKGDDNPDIEKYLGYGEIWGYYFLNEHRFGAMIRDNFSVHHNRGALQVEWSFPLLEWVSGYVQYFLGYGESLLDYDHSVNRFGVGFIFKEWN